MPKAKTNKERCAGYYAANADAINEKRRADYKAKKELREAARARAKASYENNKVARLAAAEAWRASVPKEQIKAYKDNWRRRNKHKIRARPDYRKVAANQMPAWADRRAMEDIYALAELMSVIFDRPYEVDHFIPLRGHNVCGLHVETNLRVITKEANREKGNKLTVR